MVRLLICLGCLLVAGCEAPASSPSQEHLQGLDGARSLYAKGEYARSAEQFSACLQQKGLSQPVQEEAQFGRIVSSLLAQTSSWKNAVSDWHPGLCYYWQGKAFTFTDGLPSHGDALAQSFPPEHPAHRYFLLTNFLLQKQHFAVIPLVLQEIEPATAGYEFCLSYGWETLKQGRLHLPLLKLLEDWGRKRDMPPELREEVAAASLIAKILDKPDLTWNEGELNQVTTWQYRLDRQVLDFFRANSPAQRYAKSCQNLPWAPQRAELLLADMLFVLAGRSQQRIPLWNKGLRFLQTRSPNTYRITPYAELHQLLTNRFYSASAWDNFTVGDPTHAMKIFENLAAAKEVQWQQEAKSGLTLIAWKKEEIGLEELSNSFIFTTWPNYFLAGKQFDFYRLPSRQERQELIEKMVTQQPEHRSYLVLFDTMCLLGEGRLAQLLLQGVVAQYSGNADIPKIYLPEQENIPKNVYAQNQIWEKND